MIVDVSCAFWSYLDALLYDLSNKQTAPGIFHFSNFRAISVPDFQNPNHQTTEDAESDTHLHRPNVENGNLEHAGRDLTLLFGLPSILFYVNCIIMNRLSCL